MEEESKNDLCRLASTKDVLFEVGQIGEFGSRMRMCGFKGGMAHSQSAGREKR
jgi:hypothetical protein